MDGSSEIERLPDTPETINATTPSKSPASRRHRKPPDQGRYAVFNLRLTQGERERLQSVARETGQSCSNFLRLGIAIGRRLLEIHAEAHGYHLERIASVIRERARSVDQELD